MTTAVPAGVTTLMAKTPFLRNVSSSFDDDDEDNEEDENAELEPEQNDDNIQIIKKNNAVQPQANAMAVVNKMSQSVYADHQNQAQYPPKGLKRYKILSLIGDGTYGLVYMATNVETREKVAIKAMKRKYHSWDEVMDLREVKSLKKLHHPNVVKLKEVIRENSRLYFVFEYVKGDLLGLMREKAEPFPEFWIRSVIQQVLQGLAYMHRLGFFHRDLKPENILATGPDVVKIADFGLVREIRSSPPYTDYVSTRWYRAPEVLLRSTNYNSPIDVWAVGCITSELYTKRPLFPGTSEIDQLYKIASILGTPSRNDWPDGHALANAMSFRFPTFQPTHLSQILGSRSSARAVSFLYALLSWNPSWRSSAQEALRHSFFRMSNTNSVSKEANNEESNKAVDILDDGQQPQQSMLSLSLRPRNNQVDKDNNVNGNSFSNNQRLPLPLTEIEPHYSRDLSRSIKQEEQRPKTPPQPAPQPLQPPEELKDEDLNDLISAFSLESTSKARFKAAAAGAGGPSRGSKLFILSPAKSRLAKFEAGLGGSPGALRLPRRALLPGKASSASTSLPQQQRTFQLQNAYNSSSTSGLNFSPTTTKFTLLYGHHQPTTFKIVSPAKLGLDHSLKSESDSKKIEEIMGKRITAAGNKFQFNAPPVFRSLPDFCKKPTNNNLTPTKMLKKPFNEPSMNVNGKGLDALQVSPEKSRIQVRPDWAAKYLK